MLHLSERDRIQTSKMIGYSDPVRTHEEVSNIFKDLHPK